MSESEMEKVDLIIIGGGVVGAALAKRFSKKYSIFVLEKHSRIAEGVTSRNSGVIHSGIYYPPSSLKAKLCVRGKELLYEWCSSKSVPHIKTGKAIIATQFEEDEQLDFLHQNALDSGAKGLLIWSKHDLHSALPSVNGVRALFASETGIVDPYSFTRSLFDVANENGVSVITDAQVLRIEKINDGYEVVTSRGEIYSSFVFNAAGLYADEVARMVGINKYRIYPCRGDYFRFRSQHRYSHLVYPVKAKGAAGLGVHLTLGLDGTMRLGPDVEYVESKEDFKSREDKIDLFKSSAEKLFGPIEKERLSYDQCGIRPKLRAPHEKEEKDFVISQDLPGFVNLIGIESPGLTAALAIAEYVEKMLI